jgi:hypothetical protein
MRWRVKSPTGKVHRLTTRRRWGLFLTGCGLYFDRGWGPTQDPLDCLSCIARSA